MSHAEESGTQERGADIEPADRLGKWPIAGLFVLYLLTILGGIALADPFQAAGVQTFENPENVGNVGLVFVEITIFTVLFVLILKYDIGKTVLRALILAVFGYAVGISVVGVFPGAVWSTPIGIGAGVLTWLALWVHPEWYVIDGIATIAGAAIIAQLGNGLGPLPVLLFLVGMAIYDAYAVYVSEHMQKLGSGVGEMRLPMMYVIPPTLSFSMDDMDDPFAESEDEGNPAPSGDGKDEDEGSSEPRPMFLGLGDAIVPGLLAVSAGQFLRESEPFVAGTVLNAPALGAVVGSIVGLVGLLVLVHYVERPHAGLPVLNTAVIAGYLLGAVLGGVPLTAALGL